MNEATKVMASSYYYTLSPLVTETFGVNSRRVANLVHNLQLQREIRSLHAELDQ